MREGSSENKGRLDAATERRKTSRKTQGLRKERKWNTEMSKRCGDRRSPLVKEVKKERGKAR